MQGHEQTPLNRIHRLHVFIWTGVSSKTRKENAHQLSELTETFIQEEKKHLCPLQSLHELLNPVVNTRE